MPKYLFKHCTNNSGLPGSNGLSKLSSNFSIVSISVSGVQLKQCPSLVSWLANSA